MICFTDYKCATYRYEGILDTLLDDHPGEELLDFPWEDKSIHNDIVVSELKEGIN